MATHLPYESKADAETIDFHVAFLCRFLLFLRAREMRSSDELRRVQGRGLLSEALWKIGEANLGPYRKHNVRFYSEKAHTQAMNDNLVPTSKDEHDVEHEHVIPRILLEERLLACLGEEPETGQLDEAEVGRLAHVSVGCIVTAGEHRLLPSNPWGRTDPTADRWRRYRNAENGPVRVWDRKAGNWVDLDGAIPD